MSTALSLLNAPKTLRALITAAETNPAIAGIINIFSNSAESAALYGTGNTRQFVTAIYEHLLGRAPDAEGLAFWSDNIDNGAFSRAMGAFQIMAGAAENTSPQGVLDAQLLANRVAAASYFTPYTNSTYSFEYKGDEAAALARKALDGVTASMTSIAYKGQINTLMTNLGGSPRGAYINSDTGTSTSDNITSQDKGLQILGKAGQGVVVEVFVDGATTAAGRSAPVANGNFLVNVDLAEGTHTLVLKPANAPNMMSSTIQVTIDKTAPAALTIPVTVAANADGGINASEFTYANSPKVVVDIRELNAVVGQKIEFMIDGKPYYANYPANGQMTVTAADIARGNVTFTMDYYLNMPTQGSHVLGARVYDLAGNVSATGGATSIFIDTVSPTAPTLTINNTSIDSYTTTYINAAQLAKGVSATVALSSADAIAGNVVRMSLGFGGKAPDRVIDTVLTASAVSAGYLNYSFGASDLISNGTATITATLRDAAGNWSYGNAKTLTIDSTAPGAPTKALSIPALADGTLRPAERYNGVAIEVDLTGTGAGNGDKVELLADGKPFAKPVYTFVNSYYSLPSSVTLTASDYNGWPLADSVLLSARIIDAAGNVGLAGSATKALLGTYDLTLAYNAVSVPSNDNGGISAAEKAAGIAVNVSLANSNAKAGDTVSLSVKDTPFATPITHAITAAEISASLVKLVIAGSQNWGSGDGSYTLRTTLADSVGNSSVRDSYVTIDTTAPGPLAAPTTMVGTIRTTSDYYYGASLTFDIAGSGGKQGDTVEVYVDGKPVKSGYVSWPYAYGTSTTTVSVGIDSSQDAWKTDGLKTITARVVDQVGNPGPISASYTITVDNTGPHLDAKSPPVYTDVNHNGKIDAGDTFLLTYDEKIFESSNWRSIKVQHPSSSNYTYDAWSTVTLAADGLHATMVIGQYTDAFVSGDVITLVGFQDVLGNPAIATFTV